jgi:hypothetical protein
VVSLEQGINPNNFDRYLEQFRKQYAGSRNARTPILLGHGAKVFQTSFTPVEMDFINSRNAHRDAILALYGVNKIVAGVQEANAQALKEARMDFWVGTIIPYLVRFQAALNRALTPEFESDTPNAGEKLFIWPDLSNVDAMRENIHDKARTAALFGRLGLSVKALNRRLDLQFRPDELEYLDYALMPASTRYLPEIIQGLNEPTGDPGQAQPDSDTDPLEPGDHTDDPTAEGLEGEKTWTIEEAKSILSVYNVDWDGEVTNDVAIGFQIATDTEKADVGTLILSYGGIKSFTSGGRTWVAFRKRGAGEDPPGVLTGE